MTIGHSPSARRVLDAFRLKGYRIFADPRGYDLNLFGVRTVRGEPNRFDDWIGALYFHEDRWCCYAFPGTTDPGRYWLLHPMRIEGTAVLKPGQHFGSHVIGEHKGYPALRQDRPVTVWRDPNRDENIDFGGDEDSGMFGINIHRASAHRAPTAVGKWSAGCQVVQDPTHFDFLMALARKASSIYGPRFSYTLLTSDELP